MDEDPKRAPLDCKRAQASRTETGRSQRATEEMTDAETVERVAGILQGERLCVRCSSYQRGGSGFYSDNCLHPKATHEAAPEGGDIGVRDFAENTKRQFSCFAMRAGICGRKALLFEPKE